MPGERVTNARRYLVQMMGAETVAALGAAFAEAQTVRYGTIGPQGMASAEGVKNGAAADYALGRAARGVMGEFTRYLRERLDREVDVVYVAPGTGVSVHLETELRIDYRYDARKVRLRGGGPVRRRLRRSGIWTDRGGVADRGGAGAASAWRRTGGLAGSLVRVVTLALSGACCGCVARRRRRWYV